ncbi:MAG: hypothetical protein M0R80_22550 [Proteobacteria bacterium]|nr:hypothetical protein [Pseudomonadota bacterium]
MRWATLGAAILLLASAPRGAVALDLSTNPERSFFVGFDLGAGLDAGPEARRAEDGREAYSPAGLLFGFGGGFRFDEIVGVEAGLTQSRHAALEAWGGTAGYTLAHVALRLAIPTPSRQTIVFELGPAIGGFFFGVADGIEDNEVLAAGGDAGIALEHELSAAIVVVFQARYAPLWRRGMHLYLSESDTYESELVAKDEIDLSGPRVVHLVWMTVGFQFEWVIP